MTRLGSAFQLRQLPAHYKFQSQASQLSVLLFFPQAIFRGTKMADDTRENELGSSVAPGSVAPPKKLPKGFVLGKDGKP